MCYHASTPTKKELKKVLEPGISIEDYPHYYHANGFKHPDLPVLSMLNPKKVKALTWGFIPENASAERAAKFQRSPYSLNAKTETMFTEGIYKEVAKTKRCLVFVNGFFEWKHVPVRGRKTPKKIPHFILIPDRKAFAFGGLVSEWYAKGEDEPIITHNILTTEANKLMASIHNTEKRMPFIIDEENWDLWLDKSATEKDLKPIIHKYPEGFLDAHTVNLTLKRDLDTNTPDAQEPI